MTITIDKNRYQLGLWNAEMPEQAAKEAHEHGVFEGCTNVSLLVHVCAAKDGPPTRDWVLTFRFRYSRTTDPFDQEDKKNWHRAEITDLSEEEVIEKVEETIKNPKLEVSNWEFIPLRCMGRDAVTILQQWNLRTGSNWIHTKRLSKEEEKDMYPD